MDYGKNKEPKFFKGFDVTSLVSKWGVFRLEVLYMGYFGSVASEQSFGDLDIKKFHLEFPEHFGKHILGYHFRKNADKKTWQNEFTYILENEIILNKDEADVTVYFKREDCKLLKEIFSFIKTCKKQKENKASINLIIAEQNGLDNKKISFPKPKLDLSKIYNDDFKSFHDRMLKVLREKEKSGLHLLYGPPGTGKSTYIKYLCSLVKKEIVFLPGQMAQNLDNVEMLKYLMHNPNCILIIEDAEELIVARDRQRNSSVSMILNLTDGILGESLGIQIIATFNTDVKNIDPALKRKGRLKTAYEFKALSAEKANVLINEQNPDISATGDMTLAEIFNVAEEEQYKEQERKAVGFR
jgi:energy-coupling factor transporter ATP-binding protein EcfA2